MDPKSSYKIVLLFLSIYLPSLISQSDRKNPTCGEPFSCGNIPNITYPFWDAARNHTAILCGYPKFTLDCSGDAPILNISQQRYRVLSINFFNYTLQVARQDLWNDTCSPILADTTLHSDHHFTMLEGSDYRSITLYYNCSVDSPLPNHFTCGSSGTRNFVRAGNLSAGPGDGFACRQHVTIPVKASALEASASASENALRHALNRGFPIHWWAENEQCADCSRLGGECAYDRNASKFHCDMGSKWRPDPRDPPPARPPTPLQGNPIVQSPEIKNATSVINLGPNSRRVNRGRIILGMVFGAIAFTLASILVSWYGKTRYFRGGKRDPKVEMFLSEHGSLAPKRYKYSEIKKITKSFSNKLGQGGYGKVYKGLLPNDRPVAVKILNETDSKDEEFINEVASISRTSHVNIVSLLGFCYERKKRALVYEFMPNNSLDKFMKDANASLDLENLYKIAIGVAKGLAYLHRGCNTRIVHFDIKPQNILLDEGFCPKISDFGLSKLCKKKQSILSMLGMRGTAGYIAPEVFFRNFGGVSDKSDVYSYGIMILEMAGARNFVEAETIQSCENYFPDKIYEEVILSHGMKKIEKYHESMVELEDEGARKMFLVGFWCIQTMPSDRPMMSKVVEMLEGSLESIQIPPKPSLFNPKLLTQAFSPSLPAHVEIECCGEYESMETSLIDSRSEEEN